jgi:hypothetical protein
VDNGCLRTLGGRSKSHAALGARSDERHTFDLKSLRTKTKGPDTEQCHADTTTNPEGERFKQ